MKPFTLWIWSDDEKALLAEGVIFSDGHVVIRWIYETHGTLIHDSWDSARAVHGDRSACSFPASSAPMRPWPATPPEARPVSAERQMDPV